MAEQQTPKKANQATVESVESPTTAKPISMDDDEESILEPASAAHPKRSSSNRAVHFGEPDEAPPAKPPRPVSPNTAATETLAEAFPTTDRAVIRAVLVASGGKVEPAFNALLSMSDPDFKGDDVPPPQPPRPTQAQRQLEQDELYARQLAEHYAASEQRRAPPQDGRGRPGPAPNQQEEREYSFMQDELPEIRENLRQGFLHTQRNINKWVSDFRKRIDGESPSPPPPEGRPSASTGPDRYNFGPKQSDQLRGIQRNADQMRARQRQSTDAGAYDADPRVLSDNFTELELHDAETEERPPPKPARPLANPDLFKPTPPIPQGAGMSGQESGVVPKVVDEVDALYGEPTTGAKATAAPASAGKSKKWQPLTSVAPAPEADDDPFKLDDDEDDKGEDVAKEATERLKRASVSKGAGEKKEIEESEKSGTKDKAAEQLLTSDKSAEAGADAEKSDKADK